MKTFYTPKSVCPTCGYVVDAASIAVGPESCRPPSEGDISLCFKCGEVMVFRDDLSLRLALLDDLLGLTSEARETLEMAQRRIREERPVK